MRFHNKAKQIIWLKIMKNHLKALILQIKFKIIQLNKKNQLFQKLNLKHQKNKMIILLKEIVIKGEKQSLKNN